MNDPTPTPTGVWLPLPFFNQLLDAYYGAGPLHPSARPYSPPEPTDPSPPIIPPPDIPLADSIVGRRNWIPRGTNARGTMKPNEPSTPPGSIPQ